MRFRHGLSLLAVGAVIGSEAVAQAPRPHLGVVVVVDQMRADFLTRFGGLYTRGLATLARRGAVYTDAHQDHAITETAVGHATITTGVFPRRHGVVGNSWFDRRARQVFYASEDSTAPTLGLPGEAGRSPVQLRAGTVGDWLKAQSPRSKVVAIALKDRAAAFMGGHEADGAYWYLENARGYVTSTYYGTDSIPWLARFNRSGRIESYARTGWHQASPPETYFVAREDSFPTEADGVRVSFPHLFSGDSTGPSAAYYRELRSSPFADELTFELAKLLVEQDSLGGDESPDLLFIGCSAADYIGHTFGPLSQEAEDYYLRLDAMLAAFMGFLDARVGRDRYFLILTSDHGALPLPEDLLRRGFPAGRVSRDDLHLALQEAIGPLQEQGLPMPRIRFANGLIFDFGDAAVPADKLESVRRSVAEGIRGAGFVEDAYTYEELQGAGEDRPFLELYRRQFPEDLAPDVALRFAPFTLVGWGDYGTTHGSPYEYDTHIPLVVIGAGVPAERYDRRVRSVDIAPTIARLLGIDPPAGLDGTLLEEVFPKH